MGNVKKLITFSLPKYAKELAEVEEQNKSHKGSEFVCEAVRFYMQNKGSKSNNPSDESVRNIAIEAGKEAAQEEFKKLLANHLLIQKEEDDEEPKPINAFDFLNNEKFNQNFEKFEEVEYSNTKT